MILALNNKKSRLLMLTAFSQPEHPRSVGNAQLLTANYKLLIAWQFAQDAQVSILQLLPR